VNLIEQFGRERTREVLESSFAQFQADRAVVDLARTVRKNQDALAGYARAMTCHLGDYEQYAALRRELSDLERGTRRVGEPSEKADKLRRQKQIEGVRTRMRKHPCHGCADREAHARWAERWYRLSRETENVSRQITGRTGAVAAVFDRITDILAELKYLETDEHGRLGLTTHGRSLRRIYGERDLLVAESLRRGLWRDLDVPSLAAMASAIVFEARRDDGQAPEYALPRGAFRSALERTQELWARLDDLEREHRLPGSEPLATTLALPMHRWAAGGSLDTVLRDADLAAGDFVRWTKQTIDLLDQISIVADGQVGRTARSALDATRRGIVAYSSVA
ncbi:MAG: RNA helicase, partial [Microbacteriaceae bacterium]|nr:RNA helicase [Microbacteriaceae bacterium]